MTPLENQLKCFLNGKREPHRYERLQDYLRQCLGRLTLQGARVLEIGAGSGDLAALCLANGAGAVVAIDPGKDGAAPDIREGFDALRRSVPQTTAIQYLDLGLEEYGSAEKGQRFDFVLMRSVINHLDEAAAQRLHQKDADRERTRYVRLFEVICGLLHEKGVLIASDVGRYNLWNSLGLVFPTTPSLAWRKHQDPPLWTALLQRAGLTRVEVRWLCPYRLRHLRAILAHGPIIRSFNSHFVIRATR
jgi:SAM-dependent methyltransferase